MTAFSRQSKHEEAGGSCIGAQRPYSLEAQSHAAVEACRFGPGFVRPAYSDFCFSNLPGFFEQVLFGSTTKTGLPTNVVRTIGSYQHVLFVFIDAFGWESFQRFRDSSPFLRAFDTDGVVLKTTSQFPSTTATHVSTIFSGLSAYEHEVCGWDYYEPRVGRMIKPLKFAYSEDSAPNTLIDAGFDPQRVFRSGGFVPQLIANEALVGCHGPAAFFPSPFTLRYAPPESIHGFRDFGEGLHRAMQATLQKPARSYQSVYVDTYDTVCHEHGVGSRQADEKALEILKVCETILKPMVAPQTLLVVSSDHGQISDQCGGKIAVNQLIGGLENMVKRDSRGGPIRFSGGKRSLFLHPKEEAKEPLLSELRSKLNGAATVMTTPEALQAGLLGPGKLNASYADRLGSIYILPHAGYSVHWSEPPQFKDEALSGHGGVSPQEMETPLLLLPL